MNHGDGSVFSLKVIHERGVSMLLLFMVSIITHSKSLRYFTFLNLHFNDWNVRRIYWNVLLAQTLWYLSITHVNYSFAKFYTKKNYPYQKYKYLDTKIIRNVLYI